MVTVRKSKLLTPTSVIPENTYYYEFDCDTIAELPTATYQGTNVAHGSLATIIANGRQYRINGEGEWCIQRYDASDPILIEKTITENGTYSAVDDDADGYSSVTADVPNTYTESDEGKVVDNGELVAQTARAESITANGTYDTTTNNSVTVDVVGENNAKFIYDNTASFLPNKLQKITIPSGYTTLPSSRFSGYSYLSDVVLPDTLLVISNYAFTNCTSLTAITIPSSVTTIGQTVFNGCTNLQTITINQAEGSISGAPWGAPETTQIVWTG